MKVSGKLQIGLVTVVCLIMVGGTTAFVLWHKLQFLISDRNHSNLAEPSLASINPPGVLWQASASNSGDGANQTGDSTENAAALAVIRDELRDATPDEQEIWYTELKQHTPEQIREILSLHRRMWPGSPALLSDKIELIKAEDREPKRQPEQEAASLDTKSADTGVVFESSIRAIESAEQVILNNIANASTIGFKRSRPVLAAETQGSAKARRHDGPGAGTRLAAIQVDHSQGRLRQTKRPYDLAVEGEGYFQINDGEQFLYTREGAFSTNAVGQVVLIAENGSRPLEPTIVVPQDATQVVISPEGVVSVLESGRKQRTEIGVLQLARFSNPARLKSRGNQLFEANEASGHPRISAPGQAGLGEIRQGSLEEANVDLPDELVELRRLQAQLQALRSLQGNPPSAANGSRGHSDVP